jgi:hypothetical protein
VDALFPRIGPFFRFATEGDRIGVLAGVSGRTVEKIATDVKTSESDQKIRISCRGDGWHRQSNFKLAKAERRAGKMLRETERNKGGRPPKTSSTERPVSLADLGVTKTQSSRWQRLAELEDDGFEAEVERAAARERQL